MEKTYKYCFIITGFLLFVSLCGNSIQQYRLGKYMVECEHYRAEYQRAQDREREIGECISRTAEILSSTEYSIAELRKKLKEVESSYNYMWELLSNNDNALSDKEE